MWIMNEMVCTQMSATCYMLHEGYGVWGGDFWGICFQWLGFTSASDPPSSCAVLGLRAALMLRYDSAMEWLGTPSQADSRKYMRQRGTVTRTSETDTRRTHWYE